MAQRTLIYYGTDTQLIRKSDTGGTIIFQAILLDSYTCQIV